MPLRCPFSTTSSCDRCPLSGTAPLPWKAYHCPENPAVLRGMLAGMLCSGKMLGSLLCADGVCAWPPQVVTQALHAPQRQASLLALLGQLAASGALSANQLTKVGALVYGFMELI